MERVIALGGGCPLGVLIRARGLEESASLEQSGNSGGGSMIPTPAIKISPERPYALLTGAVADDGEPILHGYRFQPTSEHDSGWQFDAGTEDDMLPSRAKPIWVLRVAVMVPEIAMYLDFPPGTELARASEGSPWRGRLAGDTEWRRVDLVPSGILPAVRREIARSSPWFGLVRSGPPPGRRRPGAKFGEVDLSRVALRDGAGAWEIAAARRWAPGLPADYLAFMRRHNGGEGWMGAEDSPEETNVTLWRLTDLRPMNAVYEVDFYAPGLLIFGSNGGIDAYAFDRRASPWRVVSAPWVEMSLEFIEEVSGTFTGFLGELQMGWDVR